MSLLASVLIFCERSLSMSKSNPCSLSPANDDGVKSVQFILDSFKKVLSSDTNENVPDDGEKNNE